MRAVFIIALFAFGLGAIAPANAGHARKHQFVFGRHAYPIVVYDYEPGVIVRAYWFAPWRNRHYFPTTGTAPDSGRLEDLSAPRETPEPAETFQRSWSTSSAFTNEDMPVRPVSAGPEPRAEQFSQPSESVKPEDRSR
jgi:hypothetical protein